MALWQMALLAFVAAWIIQSFGVWRQMQHYQKVFSSLRMRWSDGAMGAGAAPSKLGKGCIALVVVCPKKLVRTVHVMQGRSVFAQFQPREEFNGMTLAALKARASEPGFDKSAGLAIVKAAEQIEKVGGLSLAGPETSAKAALSMA